jgi:hypothetical protein
MLKFEKKIAQCCIKVWEGAIAMGQVVKKIYLHWTATDYNWAEPGHYHTVILGNGTVKRMTGYDQALKEHTARRNVESVGLAIACMGGDGWSDFPPTSVQIENLCKEAAQLALHLGWKPEDITINRIMTHAEAAANRDFPLEAVRQVSGLRYPSSTPQAEAYEKKARSLGLPHENYGPAEWFDGWPGGFCERWDLWQLKSSDKPGEGGIVIREKIKKYVTQMASASPALANALNNPANQCKILLNSKPITTGILLADNRCYAKVGDLATAYGMKANWNNKTRYINLLSPKFKPKFLADSPLIPGYPAIDIYMNRPQDVNGDAIDDPKFPARPFMQGILINNSTHVPVGDFCKELGIALTFEKSDRTLHLGVMANG